MLSTIFVVFGAVASTTIASTTCNEADEGTMLQLANRLAIKNNPDVVLQDTTTPDDASLLQGVQDDEATLVQDEALTASKAVKTSNPGWERWDDYKRCDFDLGGWPSGSNSGNNDLQACLDLADSRGHPYAAARSGGRCVTYATCETPHTPDMDRYPYELYRLRRWERWDNYKRCDFALGGWPSGSNSGNNDLQACLDLADSRGHPYAAARSGGRCVTYATCDTPHTPDMDRYPYELYRHSSMDGPLIQGYQDTRKGACRTADGDAGSGMYSRADHVENVAQCASECDASPTCVAFEFTGVTSGEIGCELHRQPMPVATGHPNGLCYNKIPDDASLLQGVQE